MDWLLSAEEDDLAADHFWSWPHQQPISTQASTLPATSNNHVNGDVEINNSNYYRTPASSATASFVASPPPLVNCVVEINNSNYYSPRGSPATASFPAGPPPNVNGVVDINNSNYCSTPASSATASFAAEINNSNYYSPQGSSATASFAAGPPPHVNGVVEIKNSNYIPPGSSPTASFAGGPPPSVATDSHAYLKSLLDLECAAVALTSHGSRAIPRDSVVHPDNGSQISNTSPLGSQVPLRDTDAGGPLGLRPPLSLKQKKSEVKSTTTGASGDQSDDDVVEGWETGGATKDMDPADVKRARRMLSNREAARRSRMKKQAHLTELETQVSQLRFQISSLLKQLSDVTKKYNKEAANNRALKADAEGMRAKVKMAEEIVKRINNINPMLQAMSEIRNTGMPSFAASPCETSADAAVPYPNQQFYQQASNNCTATYHDPETPNCLLPVDIPPVVGNAPPQNPPRAVIDGNNKMGRTPSMQRVAGLEHLQKRIRGGICS